MTVLRAALAAAVAAAGLALGACGKDDGGGDEQASTRTETVKRSTRIEVIREIGDESFDPEAIYDRDGPGVVTVIAAGLESARGEGSGLGSGFVVSERGEVATNAHVVTSGEGAKLERAERVYVRFSSGDQVSARIVGIDPFADVALLKVDPKGLRLRPLRLAASRTPDVGEPVAAIGSPFGEERSLSIGVVSATDRDIESLTGFRTGGAIQTDAAINSGNSGGPLLNARGEVLGINSQIRTRSGDGSGVGFAVPVETVRRSIAQLRRDGKVRYAYLGVSTRGVYPQLAEHFDLGTDRGAWVQEVAEGGPGDKAGLEAGDEDDAKRFQEVAWVPDGDVITAVAGRKLKRDTDLGRIIGGFRPGQRITLEIVRDGEPRQVQVTLGERPVAAPRG
ncbi:MAG TPA: trypsin-like peptidase domain-containing protein [Baekduia sp.]|nr:trypsin-like peptidase domain-containing protein [Baekduia sp.]